MRNNKKPKGFQPGSKKGQKNQLLSDKIKEAKENGFAWLTFQHRRIKITPPNFDGCDDVWGCDPCPAIKGQAISRPEPGYGYPYVGAFIKSRSEGIVLTSIWRHEGRLKSDHRTYLDEKEVLAIIVENHPREYLKKVVEEILEQRSDLTKDELDSIIEGIGSFDQKIRMKYYFSRCGKSKRHVSGGRIWQCCLQKDHHNDCLDSYPLRRAAQWHN